jgi:hypothetical protein
MAIPDDDILPEYSLKGGMRGKYADRYARSTAGHGEALDDKEIGAEAHRRWEAYLRGEEEMIPFEEVMAEIRNRGERSAQNPEQ